MGFCYQGRKLVCDKCSGVGAVRKRACTFGYCPPVALCSDCYKAESATLRKWHREHCKEAHEKYMAAKAVDTANLKAGKWLLAAAFGTGKFVHVCFRNEANETREFFIPSEIYRQRPTTGDVSATLDEFERWNGGPFKEAPKAFISDPAEIDRQAAA